MKKIMLILPWLLALAELSCSQTEKKDEPSKLYQVRVNRKTGYIDRTGKIIIKPQFEFTGNFSEGLAWISFTERGWFSFNEKVGFIDTTGRIVITPRFNTKSAFYNGLATVNIGGSYNYKTRQFKGGKWGVIDKTGNFVVKPQYDDAWYFTEGLAWIKKEIDGVVLIQPGK